MRRRPFWLLAYSLLLAGIALSLPVQLFILYGHNMGELALVTQKLSLTNWLLILLMPALAYSAWQMSVHFKWLAPLTVAVTALNNTFVATYGEDYSPIMVHAGSILFSILAFAPYLSVAFREILAHPGRRWWRAESRQVFMQPVTLFAGGRLITETLSFDISTGGIFVQSPDYNFYGLNSGDTISVRWLTPQAEAMEVDAQVVRTSEAQGRYPRGIGIKFSERTSREAFC